MSERMSDERLVQIQAHGSVTVKLFEEVFDGVTKGLLGVI